MRNTKVQNCYSSGGEGGGFVIGIGNNALTISDCEFKKITQHGNDEKAGGIFSFSFFYQYFNFIRRSISPLWTTNHFK
jgi:hypothetical protein